MKRKRMLLKKKRRLASDLLKENQIYQKQMLRILMKRIKEWVLRMS
jgi:hypothetical protein